MAKKTSIVECQETTTPGCPKRESVEMKYDRRQNDAITKWIDQQHNNIYDKAKTTSEWWQNVNKHIYVITQNCDTLQSMKQWWRVWERGAGGDGHLFFSLIYIYIYKYIYIYS